MSPKKLSRDKVLTEIINLRAITQLPKATEHFISDLHGEFEAFDHIMRNCSGVVSVKVNDLFRKEMTERDRDEFTFQIYYPEDLIVGVERTHDEWLILLDRLVKMTRYTSTKYTRSKVRKAMPEQFAYILEELLYQYDEDDNKEMYYEAIYESVIDLGLVEEFSVVLTDLIKRFVVDHLHVLGDIYDRGPHPDKIVDRLMEFPSLDIQLGNHDVIWMGAVSGSYACMANVLRISLRYGHVDLLEKNYGIDLTRLKKFAETYYDESDVFYPRGDMKEELSEGEQLDISKMQQAVAIMQFKLEEQIIKRRPEFEMDDRLLLGKISSDRESVEIDGVTYPIVNGCFQLVDSQKPEELLFEEELVLLDLMHQFQTSERLKEHVNFLVHHGRLYHRKNGNLLFHGCVPCEENGEFKQLNINGEMKGGRKLMDHYQEQIFKAYVFPNVNDDIATDTMWYLWCGKASNLFGKETMKTFERYFIEDKATHKEPQNPYYELRNDEAFCEALLREFNLQTAGYIINGHTPIKAMEGENPVKANGKMLVIDGGLSKAYQRVTGIAGYTLIDNSHEVYLVAHEPFTDREDSIKNFRDILPSKYIVKKRPVRAKVEDTDTGYDIGLEIDSLLEEL